MSAGEFYPALPTAPVVPAVTHHYEVPVVPASAEDLMRAGIERGATVETMRELLALSREIRAERAKSQFLEALAAFQEECPPIVKRRAVLQKDSDLVRYKYADLPDIVRQVKGLMKKHGFSHSQKAIVEPGWVICVCHVHHIGGHTEPSEFKVPVDTKSFMSSPQQYASALTFAKRYAFCDALGIMTSDEDTDATLPPASEDDSKAMHQCKRFIWDTLKKKHQTKQGVQQHLWDEGYMETEDSLERANLETLQRIVARLQKESGR